MAIYDLDSINEMNTKKNNDLLDNLVETCSTMLDMIDESTAVQRHFGVTAKDYDRMDDLHKGFATNNPKAFEKPAYKAGKAFHDGSYDKKVNRVVNKQLGREFSDRDREVAKTLANANNKGYTGHILGRFAQTGADVKSAYERGAAKGDKKRAIKETCEYILSVIDEIE